MCVHDLFQSHAILIVLTLICGAVLLPACAETASRPGIAMYASAKSGLIVRGAPSTESAKLGLIPYGGEVVVIDQGESEETIAGKTGRWAQIQRDGGDAWVFGGFLTANRPAAEWETATVLDMQIGDSVCQLDVDFGGSEGIEWATFEVCEQELVGKRIRYRTEERVIQSAFCYGNPECGIGETETLIVEVEVL